MTGRLMRVGAAVITLGCTKAQSATLKPAPATVARATIGQHTARFVFPLEATDRISWPGSPPHSYVGDPLHYWEVGWESSLSDDRVGEDPEGILLLLTWQKDPTQQWR